jgi:acyl CoA:acetate/3-ketoacid CoA transferase beta subunit
VQRCSYALTEKACVDILVTKLALFRRCNGVLVIEQVAPGITMEEVLALTGIDAAAMPSAAAYEARLPPGPHLTGFVRPDFYQGCGFSSALAF